MALNFPDSSIEQTYIAPNGTTYIWNGSSWVVTPVLPVSRGGTGFTTYAHGDILYGDSSKQLNKLTAGTSGQALLTAGPGADPYWGTVSAGGAGTAPHQRGARRRYRRPPGRRSARALGARGGIRAEPDFVEDVQDCLVSAAVGGAPECCDSRRDAGEGIGAGGAGEAYRRR